MMAIYEMAQAVKKLEEISLLDLTSFDMDNIKMYSTMKGEAKAVGLFKNEEFAVAITTLNEGDSFPEHSHIYNEYILVVKGDGVVTVEGKNFDYSGKTFLHIGKNEKHSFRSNDYNKSVFISILIPSEDGFPEGVLNAY